MVYIVICLFIYVQIIANLFIFNAFLCLNAHFLQGQNFMKRKVHCLGLSLLTQLCTWRWLSRAPGRF